MNYVLSDLHGCYKSWLALLDKIHLTNEDKIFVLGDIVDRGPEPMLLLRDMMSRSNVYPIVGNHDFAAFLSLKFLTTELTDQSIQKMEENNEFEQLLLWMSDGGQPTLQAFQKLSPEERQDILEYFQEFSFYEEIELSNGNRYLLSHTGGDEICETRPLEEIPMDTFITGRLDYNRQYFSDCIWVTGHTPTRTIPGAEPDRIYRNHNHIAIDCGCIFGGYLGVIRLEDGKEFYVENLDI